MPIPRLTVKPKASFEDFAERAGTFVDLNEIDEIIDYDCDAYDPEGRPLFFFRKGVIPMDVCRQAHSVLRHAAQPSKNRGNAAGIFKPEEDTTLVNVQAVQKGTGKQLTRVKKDGTLSNTHEAKTVNSGIVGYFDRSVRMPFCRQTAWTEQNFGKFRKAMPYIQAISDEFEKAVPGRYEAQKQVWEETHEDFRIPDTAFTTVTVNKNFRTAIHLDAGDYEAGLGNIAVLQAGEFEGGYTCMPRYGVGFDVRNGDVCFFNVHEWHGNTEIKAKKPYERISVVCYYRQNMMTCQSAESELAIVKARKDRKNLQSNPDLV